MPVTKAVLPLEVREARSVYVSIKQQYGICKKLICTRPAETDKVLCERCLKSAAKASAAFHKRNPDYNKGKPRIRKPRVRKKKTAEHKSD